MKFPALEEAQGKLDHARKELATAMQEAKTSRPGVYDMDQIKSVSGDKNEKLAWIQAKNAELAELKKEVEKQQAVASAANFASEYAGSEQKGNDAHEEKGGADAGKSLGELFVKSAAFKSKGQRASFDVDLKTLFQRTAGWTPESTRSGLVTLKPMVPAPSVIDHLVTIPVSQAAYKYMEETTYTNNAAEVAEGSTFGEAALALTERSQTVEKIAVWLPMTDEQLEDEPGARAYVEARLENMIRQRLDLQLLAGDGSTPNLLGTVNKAGIQTQAVGSDTLIDASYKLFTTIRTDGFAEPSVAFVRPTYWQSVALLKTTDGVYIYSNPASGVPSVLWGVPVVQTMAAPSGVLVTGDYANYAFFGVKRGIDVQVTNSHSTDFINGKQAIRMDMRGVMVHVRPKAFGTVTGLT
ncbi:MAG TPA: phage major capsid protein [Candidatus Paceibacterota bacterium]|nr:phage major capsid protein [Candidatus Paceibacterota bacterium]